MKNRTDSNDFQPRDFSLLVFVVIAILIFIFDTDGRMPEFLTRNLPN